MLGSIGKARDKRKALRAGLDEGRLLRFPGAFSPLVGMLIEQMGFDGVYISGAVLSADLGLPDIGLTTLTEVSRRGHEIARQTNLPAIIDADTGFGEPLNAARSVRMLEDLGLSGCHIEDQVNPKRCGHLDNKTVVPISDMVQRIRAAVSARRDSDFLVIARTDARAVEGFDAAVARARAYIEAGADVIFPEALLDLAEFKAFRSAISVPMLANMTEFGKSELFSTRQLADAGVGIVIYPVTTLRLAMGAVEEGLGVLRDSGTNAGLVNRMQSRQRLYDLLGYEDYNVFDSNIYNFSLDAPAEKKK